MASRPDDALFVNTMPNPRFNLSSTEGSGTIEDTSSFLGGSSVTLYAATTYESTLPDASTGQYLSQDYTFSDDALWEAMFANAGFNIASGTFLPDAYTFRDQVAEE